MLLILNNLRIPVEQDNHDAYINASADKLSIAKEDIKLHKILRKSLDISDKEQFFYDISIVVTAPDSFNNTKDLPLHTEKPAVRVKPKNINDRPIIIGMGPAGMFAALSFIEHGIKPIIFERGKKIEERSVDIKKFIKDRILDTESNIQFGEGGAGAYSDGKLFSKPANSVHVARVLDTFVKFGASEEILYMAKPHLGTDVLCRIVSNIRNYILDRGGDIHYNSKVTDILISDKKLSGVIINGDKEYLSPYTFFAIGHSARDTFSILHKNGIALEQKPVPVGVRVEHPVDIINRIRYGDKYRNFPGIGAAPYSFTYTDRATGRGAYTFCMCPGGEVVNASSENGMLVLNGMSYSKRASSFSNAAIIVPCRTDDYGSTEPLAGIEFQRNIEKKAFKAGGGTWKVPAQNLMDFLNSSISGSVNKNSFNMGTTSSDMKDIFPEFIIQSLMTAFNVWKKDYPLFVSEHAVLLASETRTTCPVRIQRGKGYESVNTKNLYPIGEGSGYTGGIMSSAVDALKAVESIIENQ